VSFVRNIMAAFEYEAQKQNIQFTFATTIDQLEFGFDRDIVDKILYNLLSNAFKFTSEGGHIAVSLSVTANSPAQVMLSVTDNGIGIKPEVINKVFEPFYQIEGQKGSNFTGTGIGLALTKELVTRHKGMVQVRSKPGVATCFTVILGNLTTETDEQLLVMNSSHFESTDNPIEFEAQAHTTEPTVILVVEDNADVRGYLKMNLSSYQVIEANNAVEGFEKAIETIPDLIISDVMMPGMDGLQFCQKVKTDERTSHIPVILLTARQAEQFQEEGYETGADDYIMKPFKIGLVLVRIKNLLESRKKLRELFNRETGFNTRLAGTNATDKAFLAKATSLIEENISNEAFNVEWLSAQMYLSRSQLYRKIKALTNQSVQDFVNTIRLNKAAALLVEGGLSVSEIAFRAGYSDSTTFGRSFQKLFGETPKKFSQKGKTQLP
jgi:DNA-binding response OmpR family regulator